MAFKNQLLKSGLKRIILKSFKFWTYADFGGTIIFDT